MITVDQAIILIDQERLDVLGEGATTEDIADCAAYVLCDEVKRLRSSEESQRTGAVDTHEAQAESPEAGSVTAWAVFGPDGKLLLRTVSTEEIYAWRSVSRYLNETEIKREYEPKGYTCRPIEIHVGGAE